MKKSSTNRLVVFDNRHSKKLEPLVTGCRLDGMLKIYRLSTAERKRLRVAADNPGVVAIIA